MKSYAYKATAAGIARLQRERQPTLATIEPAEVKRALASPAVAGNVVRFPKRVEPTRVPSTHEVSRARHMVFLAGLHIAPATPIHALITRVAAIHGFTAEQMINPCRKRKFVDARADCVAAVKLAYPKLSTPRLGQIFGGRDHTTLIHYLRKRGQ